MVKLNARENNHAPCLSIPVRSRTISSSLRYARSKLRSGSFWELAWRGTDPDARRIFRAELLEDQRVCVLAGFDEMEMVRAGGIAYNAAGTTGVTNIFGSYREFLNALVTHVTDSGPRRNGNQACWNACC
jgi:hypothetical protein